METLIPFFDNKNWFFHDKIYLIDRDLWERLDNNNKAGLVLHEIIYRESIRGGAVNSRAVRKYNGLILTGELLKTNWNDLTTLYKSLYFEEFDYRDFRVSTCLTNEKIKRTDLISLPCVKFSQTVSPGGEIYSEFTIPRNSSKNLTNARLPYLKLNSINSGLVIPGGSYIYLNDSKNIITSFFLTEPIQLLLPNLNFKVNVFSLKYSDIDAIHFELAETTNIPTALGGWIGCESNSAAGAGEVDRDNLWELLNISFFKDKSAGPSVDYFSCNLKYNRTVTSANYSLTRANQPNNKEALVQTTFYSNGIPNYNTIWQGYAKINQNWYSVENAKNIDPQTGFVGEGDLVLKSEKLFDIYSFDIDSTVKFRAHPNGNIFDIKERHGSFSLPYLNSNNFYFGSGKTNCSVLIFNEDGALQSAIVKKNWEKDGQVFVLLDQNKNPIKFNYYDRIFFNKDLYVTKVEPVATECVE
jgi:hypothetical protein